jgi:hypothetical protein
MMTPSLSAPAKQWVASPPAPKNPEAQPAPKPAAETPSPKTEPVPVQQRPAASKPEPPPAEIKESEEVDRYVSGDTTYVMFADGAVEVRTPDGAQRYATLRLAGRAAGARGGAGVRLAPCDFLFLASENFGSAVRTRIATLAWPWCSAIE